MRLADPPRFRVSRGWARPKYKSPRVLTLTFEMDLARGADGPEDPEMAMVLQLADRLAQGLPLSQNVRVQRDEGLGVGCVRRLTQVRVR